MPSLKCKNVQPRKPITPFNFYAIPGESHSVSFLYRLGTVTCSQAILSPVWKSWKSRFACDLVALKSRNCPLARNTPRRA
jgi:hypothetical protein